MSIVESSDLRLNRILKIKRQLNVHSIDWENRRMEGSHANKPASDNKTRSKCFTSEDKSGKDERSTDDASESPEQSIVYTSDDPRRGGRLGHSDNKGTKTCLPNVSPHKQAPNNGKSDDLHPAARVPSDSNMVSSSKMSEIFPSPAIINNSETHYRGEG